VAKPTYQIAALSSTTNYLPVNVVSTVSTSPTVLHTAHATNIDELWFSAFNYGNLDALLTLTLGGAATHQRMGITIPAQRGLVTVLPGYRVSGGIIIGAFCNIANTVSITGSINRIVFV
jgi:hypothetical protein